jgi:hypothetical protein
MGERETERSEAGGVRVQIVGMRWKAAFVNTYGQSKISRLEASERTNETERKRFPPKFLRTVLRNCIY